MLSSQTLLGKILRLPLSLIPTETEVRVLRGPLRGRKWIAGAATHACWAGTYEVERLRAFAGAVRPGATVYDVGANVGIYSLLAGLRTGPGGKVYAFEPAQRNLRYLHRHVELNHAQNCLILESAVSNTDGMCRFSAAPWDFSMGHLAPDGELPVPSVTLDTCVYGEKALRPPEVMKIDVEGGELQVLEGATKAIAEFHPALFLEVHGSQLHVACRDFLASRGYQVKEEYGWLTAFWAAPR